MCFLRQVLSHAGVSHVGVLRQVLSHVGHFSGRPLVQVGSVAKRGLRVQFRLQTTLAWAAAGTTSAGGTVAWIGPTAYRPLSSSVGQALPHTTPALPDTVARHNNIHDEGVFYFLYLPSILATAAYGSARSLPLRLPYSGPRGCPWSEPAIGTNRFRSSIPMHRT